MISIIIPTFNNLNYLKLCIDSIKKNSKFDNEILLHINEGSDGTLDYAKNNKLKYTHSIENEGLCIGCNKISKKIRFDLILYSHDDMYFCPSWDEVLINELNIIKTNKFYLSSIMINADPKIKGHLNFDAGNTINNFNEKKLLENYKKLEHTDFQGSTWAPHLIHKDLWNEIGGFSEEFSPGVGSDPDLNFKLWKAGVRIFKGVAKSKVYHFGSITLRKNSQLNIKVNAGSRANKIFLNKWGVSIKFFKKHYLRSNTNYEGPLDEPIKNVYYYIDLIKVKLTYCYNYLLN